MDSQILNFYILCGLSIALFIAHSISAKYISHICKQFERLAISGIEVKGKIIALKNNSNSKSRLLVQYEFQTREGIAKQGQLYLTSNNKRQEVGMETRIVYLEANPNINCLIIELGSRVSSNKKLTKITQFMPLFSLFMVGVLWLVFYTNHLVKFPF